MRKYFLLIPLLMACLAQAQMYRWTDANGKVHYADTPPPANAKNVQKKNFSGGPGSSTPLPYELQEAVKNFPVTFYTSGDCKEACAEARDLLNKRGVPYKEVSVDDQQGLESFKKVSGGMTVPVMTVGQDMRKGFESSGYHSTLDNAGYPRSSLLPPGAQARQPIKPAPKPAPAATSEAAPAVGGPVVETPPANATK